MEGPITHVPVYTQAVSYTKADGTAASLDVPLVELPAGTLLFRGIQLPNPKNDEDPRLFVRDWLGNPIGDRFCMTPTHNTFFYTSPYVPFGAHTVGEWFNAVMICQTIKPVRVVSMIGPSKWIRGGKEIKALDGTAPIQRCDKFDYTCSTDLTSAQAKKEKELKAWDNCIHPDFAQTNQVSGWMAIADYDSLDNYKEGLHGKETTMGKYILELESHLPGKGVELLASTYTDASKHRGFPEVVLFPWSPHPGAETQYTEAMTEDDAADAIAELSDRFTYLPIACITERGILDAFTGDFKAGDLPAYATTANPGPLARSVIDKLQARYLDKLMTEGVEIPKIGRGVVEFDSRTGFYVMNLIPTQILDPITKTLTNYDTFTMPLATQDEREKVLEYKIKYRTFDSKKLMAPDTYIDGTPVLARSFIFERPDELYKQFKELELKMPGRFIPYIWSATEVFQKNLATRKATSNLRGAEEARRRAGEAKQKIQESLEFLAKKKAEREAQGQKSRGLTRGKKQKGGRRTRRSKRKQISGSEEPLKLSVYRAGVDPSMEEYVERTLKSVWGKVWKQTKLFS
jgi:hypothetical protein